MNSKLKAVALVSLGIFVVLVFALAFSRRDQSLVRLQRAGVIRIGYAVEAPYAFLKPGGEVTGAEVELARAVVARLGIASIEWRMIEFNHLLAALENGQIDAIVAGMFITPERALRVNFSEPTFHVSQGLLVKAGNPFGLHSYAGLTGRLDIKIAVIAGAVEETLLRQLGLADAQIVSVPDAQTGRAAVENELVEGLALSALTIRWMAVKDQLGKTEMAQPFEQDEDLQKQALGYGAVAFRQQDRQLLAAWNAVLKDLVGAPEHLDLVRPFGFTPTEFPGVTTTKEIINRP